VYVNACSSYQFYENGGFSNSKVYLGYSIPAREEWAFPLSYYYFSYLIDKFILPPDQLIDSGGLTFLELLPPGKKPINPYTTPPSFNPMGIGEAYKIMKAMGVNPDQHTDDAETKGCELKVNLNPDSSGYEEVYFPIPIEVTVHK